jgi:hypothetical protein
MRRTFVEAIIFLVLAIVYSSRAETMAYSFDSLNRITSITYSSGGSISYSYDKAGNRTTFASIAHTSGADTTAPAVPSGLSALAQSVSRIALNWSPSLDTGGAGFAGYKIFRDGVFLVATSSTNYMSVNLVPNTYYCFTIQAYDNAANISLPSIQSCAMTYDLPRPVLILGSHNPANGIDFSFGTVSEASYRIQTSSDLKSWNDVTNFSGDGSLFFFQPSAPTNSAHFFRIVSP